MFALALRSLERLPQDVVSFWRKPERSSLIGGLADSANGIVFDIAHFLRVGEHGCQASPPHGSRVAGDARNAARLGPYSSCLAARDGLKEALHSRAGEVSERSFPEEGDDMAGDPAAIDFEGALPPQRFKSISRQYLLAFPCRGQA